MHVSVRPTSVRLSKYTNEITRPKEQRLYNTAAMYA